MIAEAELLDEAYQVLAGLLVILAASYPPILPYAAEHSIQHAANVLAHHRDQYLAKAVAA